MQRGMITYHNSNYIRHVKGILSVKGHHIGLTGMRDLRE